MTPREHRELSEEEKELKGKRKQVQEKLIKFATRIPVFMEKIKVDDNRVNITKMATTDNTYPAVTGGYITKSDKTTGGDPVA